MKTPFIILLMAVSSVGYSQNYDSLKRVILEVQQSQYQTDFYLQKAHEQYSSGTLILGIGVATAAIGTVLHISSTENNNPAKGLMIAGGATTVVGGIIQIDSHKWIGRAGRKR